MEMCYDVRIHGTYVQWSHPQPLQNSVNTLHHTTLQEKVTVTVRGTELRAARPDNKRHYGSDVIRTMAPV